MVNMPEDTTPCAIITHQAPIRPTFLNNNKLTIINDIWTTEEYAIIIFMSVVRQQKTPKIPPPKEATIAQIKLKILIWNIMEIR